LIQAVDRYDPERRVQLKTLAEHRIRGAILDYLRSLDPLSRQVRQFQRKRTAASASLERSLGHRPSELEIAQELTMTPARYRRLDYAAAAASLASLETLIAQGGEKAAPAQVPACTLENAERRRRLYDAV
jgi:RNA polymerase sigma factor for flagellar operon FliA